MEAPKELNPTFKSTHKIKLKCKHVCKQDISARKRFFVN